MIVEVTTFRLADGVDEPAAVAADHQVQVGFVHLRPGMVRRTTARAEDGGWLVLTLWDSEDSAVAAERAGVDDPLVAAFAALVAGEPEVRRYQALGG